jgi:glyoxylase-like metal-dependent hydrolase (beta-lactamase superfamily II)
MSNQPFLKQEQVGPMGNFVYTLGDPGTMKAWVVDPAWDPLGIVARAQDLGYTVEAVLATHFHQDHIGGEIFGQHIPGVRELLARHDLPVLIHSAEADRAAEIIGCERSRLQAFQDGDLLPLGQLQVEVLHTPGHSPGICCFRVGDELLTADTLFVQAIGRIDLPHSDPLAMFHSLDRLKRLPGQLRVYPGHDYGPQPSSTIEQELSWNPYLQVPSLERWRAMVGA